MIDSPFEGWPIEDDLGPARWYADALVPPEGDRFRVHGIVPASYPAVARLVHPAYQFDGDAAVAVHIRDIEHPERRGWVGDSRFTWHTGWPEVRQWMVQTPEIGNPDLDDLRALIRILGRFTSTPDDLWALMWPGWGHDWGGQMHERAAQMLVSRNPFALLHGSLDGLPKLRERAEQTPSYWWPHDRAWAVGTDLDDFCTYIAGSGACIDAVLADADLECYRTSADAFVYGRPYLPM